MHKILVLYTLNTVLKYILWKAKKPDWGLEHETCNGKLRIRVVQPEKMCAKERSYCSSATSYAYDMSKLEPHAQKYGAIEKEAKVISCNEIHTNAGGKKPQTDAHRIWEVKHWKMYQEKF